MKKVIIVCVSLLSFAATTQGSTLQKSNISPLLSVYYDIKNALVAGDENTTSLKAGELAKILKGINPKTLSATDAKAFKAVKSKLLSAVEKIAGTKDLVKQREQFADLSNNMYVLIKATHLSSEQVYQLYCPMKKVYWLSNESVVKNPYYGKAMLDCGSVTETIK